MLRRVVGVIIIIIIIINGRAYMLEPCSLIGLSAKDGGICLISVGYRLP